LLTVVQSANGFGRIEDHSGGEYRTEQGAAAGFVQPGDGVVSSTPEGPFMTAGRHAIGQD
jgi:hypothetical protein